MRFALDLLWHYTSWQGFEGIVRDGCIRVSKMSYLNDTKEAKEAVDVLIGLVKRLVLKTGLLYTEQDQAALLDGINRVTSNNTCVACFSCERDDLSQWRGYASSVIPLALGFDPEKLSDAAKQSLGARLIQCVYSPAEHERMLAPIAERMVQNWPAESSDENSRFKLVIALTDPILRDFMQVCPAIKNRAFEKEAEWRLVARPLPSNDPAWRFFQRGSLAVPYRPLSLRLDDLDLAPLEDVLVGPCAHMAHVMDSAAHLLFQKGLQRYSVSRSLVPFRNW